MSMMQFFDPTVHSMSKVLQRVDLTLLIVVIVLRIVNDFNFRPNTNFLYWTIFCGLVILLSSWMRLHQLANDRDPSSKKEQLAYAIASMLVMMVANFTVEGSELLLYWTIVKISFFLNLRTVIFIILISGAIHAIGLTINFRQIVESAARNGVYLNLTPQSLAIGQLSYYIGASILCILLGNFALAEQRSRKRSEVLMQEIETLTADLERKRISREIHDALGHTLTTLDIQLELAQKLRDRDPAAALMAIDRAKNLTTQCLQDVRLAVQTIRQEPVNFNRSLSLLIDRFRPHFNVRVELNLPLLPLQPSHQIYCILQEGFTNIQKHSSAGEISLNGWYDDITLWIELKDNGKGFDPTQIDEGFGLRSMTERAQLLGGKMEIISEIDRGTRMILAIPLTAK
jgi:signal transduction histidine kinase